MSKILRVIEPFFMFSEGDLLELSEDGKKYTGSRGDKFVNKNIESSYNYAVTITPDYAKELIEDGYLSEVDNSKQDFVNIFTEIDKLLNKYNGELDAIDLDKEDTPMCVKVEKVTVLKNMIKLLTYLKGLKK